MKELTIEAKTENLEQVIAFVDEELEANACPMKAQMQIDLAVEELFVNIAHYAYRPDVGSATIRIEAQETGEACPGAARLLVSISFFDRGIPYNPLERADPDVTLPAEEREIGGLGIFMAKKNMDEMHYEYRDGQNILTIRKGCA